jgi:hypothetical protein
MTVHPDTKKNSNDGDRFDQFPKWLWGTPSTEDTPAVPPPFSVTTAVVYVALKSHGGMKDGARPSINPRIMEMTGLGESTIWRSIRELESAGVLKVESRGRNQPNRYQFPATRPVSHSDRSAKLTDQVSHSDRPGSPKLAAERNQYRETNTERQRFGWGASGATLPGGNQETPPAGSGAERGQGAQRQGEDTSTTHLAGERSEQDLGPNKERSSGLMTSTPNYPQQQIDLANRLHSGLIRAGKRSPDKTPPNGWYNSARILLASHPYQEICDLIDWVCADDYWSGEIRSLYHLQFAPGKKAPRYAELLAESRRRQPKSASSGYQPPWRRGEYQPPWKNVSSEEKAAADRKAASGFARLEDL